MKKLFTLLSAFLLLSGFLSLPSCTKDNRDDIIPPVQNIVTTDSTGLLGRLNLRVYRYRNNKLEWAPSGTEIYLYATRADLDYDYANDKYFRMSIFRIIPSNTSNVDLGFLEKGTYYIRAIYDDYTYYEAINAVMLRQRYDTANITLEQTTRPPILSKKK